MFVGLILGLHTLASVALALLTASVAWKRRHTATSIRAFLLTTAAYAGWSGASAFLRLWALIFGPADFPGSVAGMFSAFLGWTVLYLAVSFRETSLDRGERLLLWIAGLITLVVSSLAYFPQFVTNRRFVDDVLVAERGIFFYIISLWTFALVFVGFGILVFHRIRETRPVYRIRLTYVLVGMAPAVVLAFVFSFVIPGFAGGLQRYTWIGPAASIFVTIVIFVGIARNGIYDIQTILHRAIILFFLTSLGVAVIYVPVGMYLATILVGLDLRVGLIVFFTLLVTHAGISWLFPYGAGLVLGRMRNPEDVVRQVLGLAADVERDLYDVCYDVAVLLKMHFKTQSAVAVIPAGGRYRILLSEPGDVTSSAQISLLRNLNGNERITRAFAKFIQQSPGDYGLANLGPDSFDQRKRPRVLRYALRMRDELVALGFDVFMPVIHGERLLAVFLLGRKQGQTPFFQSEHATLRTIAVALSVALKNVDDYSRVVRVNSALLNEGEMPGDPIQASVSVAGDKQIIYRGRTMERAIQEIEKAARHQESVLILGETGSGKDLAAHLIHRKSDRAATPFIAVNCGAIADSLLENELFGHERGAYTGADKSFQGLFEQASGGVLFLDEIGEISEALQVKLLRVLEDRKVPRLGGKVVPVDIRIIAATNRDLKERVDAGLFRADLYYRLNVISIRLPSLRERREDIPVLAEHFLRRFADRFGRPRARLSAEALGVLKNHDWPGNVRELENTLLRAFASAEGDLLGPADFPDMAGGRGPAGLDIRGGSFERRAGETLETFLRRLEHLVIQDALIRSAGNKAKAARDLGMSRTTFYHKIGLMDKGT